MANEKLTDKTALSSGSATDDLYHCVDVSDTTGSAAGTSKKQTAQNLLNTVDNLTALGTTPASGDKILLYDADASSAKTVTYSNLGIGSGDNLATANLTQTGTREYDIDGTDLTFKDGSDNMLVFDESKANILIGAGANAYSLANNSRAVAGVPKVMIDLEGTAALSFAPAVVQTLGITITQAQWNALDSTPKVILAGVTDHIICPLWGQLTVTTTATAQTNKRSLFIHYNGDTRNVGIMATVTDMATSDVTYFQGITGCGTAEAGSTSSSGIGAALECSVSGGIVADSISSATIKIVYYLIDAS